MVFCSIVLRPSFVVTLFISVVLTISEVHGHTTSFSFESFSTRNLTLLGDCFVQNNSLGLTRETSVPASSSGRALYSEPVRFFDPATNSSVSFQTAFAFSITNSKALRAGDGGLAFVIVPDNTSVGSSGMWLGLLNATENRDADIVAVEFDSYLDVPLVDINDNHVGLDVGSLISIASADIGSVGMDLKSGEVIRAWIEYNSLAGMLEVRTSYSAERPKQPLLGVHIALSDFVNEFMFVGFSASTEGSQELHSLYTWNFSTSSTSLQLSPLASPSPSPDTAQPSTPSSHFRPVAPFSPSPNPRMDHGPMPSSHSRSIAPFFSPSHSNSTGTCCRRSFCLSFAASVALSVGSALFMASILLAILWCTYKNFKLCERSPSSYSDTLINGPRKFTYKELSIATKGFCSSNVIGHGAFGTVYKGVLPHAGARLVAVKRSVGNNKGKSEFLAELSIIGCLRHRNLVQLLGWCCEKEEILLVYDYMAHGSLDKLLFNKDAQVLPWMHRYKIVTGIAAALAYLHDECEQQVVHRDVKASNIMLDSSFNARLGDFGLARLTDHNKSPDATLAAGTMGYLAPEYIHTGKATEKTDVFSFGAVVLEVTCGRRPLEKDLSPTENVLVDWVWGLHRVGKLLEAADRRLEGDFDEEEMNRLLQVGLLCSHPDPVARPTMRQVLQILTGEASLPHLSPFKPTPSFAHLSLPISLQDIISESSHSPRSFSPSDSS